MSNTLNVHTIQLLVRQTGSVCFVVVLLQRTGDLSTRGGKEELYCQSAVILVRAGKWPDAAHLISLSNHVLFLHLFLFCSVRLKSYSFWRSVCVGVIFLIKNTRARKSFVSAVSSVSRRLDHNPQPQNISVHIYFWSILNGLGCFGSLLLITLGDCLYYFRGPGCSFTCQNVPLVELLARPLQKQ